MPFPRYSPTLSCLLLVGALLQPAHAQVGFIVDLMQLNLCITQNWDTPELQKRLQSVSQSKRLQMYADIKFSPPQKRCLMQHKPIPVALCNKVIALADQAPPVIGGGMPFLGSLSEKEQAQLDQGITQAFPEADSPLAACMAKDTADDWLPADLQPSPAVLDILKRAQQGDVAAQVQAMQMYTTGDGVVPNPAKANLWLEKAAENGDAATQLTLGNANLYGINDRQIDYRQAITWLTKAAATNDTAISSAAMLALSRLYAEDEPGNDNSPLKANLPEARRWLQQAADNGSLPAMYELASHYAQGTGEDGQSNLGFTQNWPKALAWYQKSAQLGETRSMLALADYLDHKNVAIGQRDALAAQQWRRKADARGENGRTLNLYSYFPWSPAPDNDSDAIKIQQRHAQQGDVNAQLALASRYFYGEGVNKNEGKAREWWRKAARQGDAIGQRMLGLALLFGWGSQPDNQQARQWLEKAASQGDGTAALELAFDYYFGDRETNDTQKRQQSRNPQLGLKWLKAAAEYGYKPEETLERLKDWTARLMNADSQ